MDINALTEAFLGQAQAPQQESQWQQQLLERVSPEEQRRKQIRNTVLAASLALLKTRGGFGQGLANAAGAAGNAWAETGDSMEQQSLEAQKTVEEAQQHEADRRLRLLESALGVATKQEDRVYDRKRDGILDERYAEEQRKTDEERTYKRGLDERIQSRADRNTDSMISRRSTQDAVASAKAGIDTAIGRTSGDGKPLTAEQRRKARDSVYKLTEGPNGYRKRLTDAIESDWNLSPEQKAERHAAVDSQVAQFKRALESEYELANAAPAEAAPAPVTDVPLTPGAAGKGDPNEPLLTAPPPPETRVKGKVYNTPKGQFEWTGTGWKPAQ